MRSSSPALLAEAIHVHLVTRWRVNPAMRASWAYAVTAGCLWERTPVDLLPPLRQRIVTAVREAGATAYGLPIERVAFSTNSVAGVLHWLGALEPPVIVARGRTREVRRRVACPAAAVWWSVGALDRSEGWGGGSGTWVALDETRRDLLARALFLEPTALPDVLARAATASEALPGGPCLRYDEARDAVEVVRTVPVGTYPGITEEAGHP